ISAISPCAGRGWMCCPSGWKHFKESCYYISDDAMSWAESQQNCTGMGSHLVVINTKAEQAFLTEELKQFRKRTDYYIGLTAPAVGQWQWLDQTPYNMAAAFWRKGEPSNVAVERCVVIHTDAVIHNWNDVRCENNFRICE
ncbi:CLC4E protein, partial [Geococcyx californianus]|nr:CLC4E protein [Geococcyx californianus]